MKSYEYVPRQKKPTQVEIILSQLDPEAITGTVKERAAKIMQLYQCSRYTAYKVAVKLITI